MTVDNYDIKVDESLYTYEEMMATIQRKCRELQLFFEKINNREMDLAIVRLQEAAHWAFHSVMRHQSEKKKDE